MRSLRETCCSHRGTAVLLFLVSVWASLATLKLLGISDNFENILMKSVRKYKREQKLGYLNKEEIELISKLYSEYQGRSTRNSSCSSLGQVNRTDPVWLSFRWQRNAPPWVIYNRVPKTGSSITVKVIKLLAKQNKFYQASSSVNVFFNVSVSMQEAFIQHLYRYKVPLIYDRHVHFIDFKRFGEKQPMYINTIREPVQHYLSFYYFMRRQSMWKRRYTAKQRAMDLDECLNASLKDCEPHRQHRFFCGQDPICLHVDTEQAALALAKQNIERHYTLVGLSEDLHGFFTLLEKLVPRYFSGAGKMYTKHKNDYKHFTSKKVQPPLKQHTKDVLRNLLKYDYELYYFVRQRFSKIKCLMDDLTT